GRRNGASAPHCLPTLAISASSVETSTRPKSPQARAASMDQAIIGLPQNDRMFLRGIRLLPPRAGMTAIVSAIQALAQGLADGVLLRFGELEVERQADRPLVIALRLREVARLEAEVAVVGLEMHRNVVHVDQDAFLPHAPEHRFAPCRVVHLDHVEMPGGSGAGSLVRQRERQAGQLLM